MSWSICWASGVRGMPFRLAGGEVGRDGRLEIEERVAMRERSCGRTRELREPEWLAETSRGQEQCGQ